MEEQTENKETAKVGYTEEAPKVKSANRLIFIVGTIWAMILITVISIMLLLLMEGITVAQLTTFICTTFAALFTPIATLKVSQKFAERPSIKK
jgi:uncharacterized membrane protein